MQVHNNAPAPKELNFDEGQSNTREIGENMQLFSSHRR
jgi:hypothetical protein